MDRRSFFKLTAVAGLSLVAPFNFGRSSAQDGGTLYDGPFWITINAGGGWDPTLLCDPKGRVNEMEEDPVNQYMVDQIEEVGPFKLAPVDGHRAFFEKHRERLLVINGIDTQTNGHDSGSRNTWSGNLQEGTPSLAALIAGALAPEAPMAYVSNGGYDFTDGVVARTRSGSTRVLERIAYPNRIYTDNGDQLFHTEATVERIVATQAERTDALSVSNRLPRVKHALSTLFSARIGSQDVKRLTDFLPEDLDNSGNALRRQAQVAIAAYRAGLSVSCNLSVGGFDTHGNHDASHIPRMQALLDGVDFVMQEAERQEVADRVIVIVGSDFGRTPRYNDGNGKDHWPITSMMLMGPGITGNRLIGASDAKLGPMRVLPDSLEAVEDSNTSGLRITPAHIHKELRTLAGIDQSELAAFYPLGSVDNLNLLG